MDFWYFVRLLVLTLGVAAFHYYLWRRLIHDVSRPKHWWRYLGVSVLLVLLTFFLISRFTTPSTQPLWLQQVFGWPGQLWFAAFIFIFGMLLVLEPVRWWLWRKFKADQEAITSAASTVNPEQRYFVNRDLNGVWDRRRFLSRAVGISAGVIGSGLAGYSVFQGYRAPQNNEITIKLRQLGEESDGFRIAVVGDLHLSALRGRAHCQRVVRRVMASRADMIAIVGDLADGSFADLRSAAAPLADLQARDGVYFVTGNHEYYYDEPHLWIDYLASMGIETLANSRVDMGGFELAGINDIVVDLRELDEFEGPDFAAALEGRDDSKPVVLLAHQPAVITDAQQWDVDLVLAGHTHGGQIWPASYVTHMRNPTVSGLEQYGDTQLYVTNGVGTSGPPIRFGVPAEYTVVTLRGE